LDSINIVTSLEQLGTPGAAPVIFTIAKPNNPEEGGAIIVQGDNQGPILGAASF
jgi:hypothetical protein